MLSRRVTATLAFVFGFSVAAVAFDEDNGLHRAMESLKKHMKPLSQSIGDATKNEETLKHLMDMQGLTLESKKFDPPTAAALKDEERAKHVNDYQADMTKLLVELATMELEVRAGDNAAAQARVKSGLVKMREDGHDKFQGEEEEHRRK